MKFSCQATDLMNALKAAQSVADARPVRPIYECVRIDADDNGITVTGGNSEQQISSFVEADVQDGGVVAVPMKVLSGYVSALTDEVKIVSDKRGSITIKSGSLKAAIAGQDVNDYAVLDIGTEPVFTADAAAFATAISSVAFAIGSDKSDPKRILISAHVEVDEGGHGVAVAMSDKKMGHYVFSANMISETPVEFNIPAQTIKPLCSVLQGQDTFSFYIEKYVVKVVTEERTFIFPEVAGKYVEWQRVLNSSKHDKFAKATIPSLSDAIRFSGVSGKNGETFLANLHFSKADQTLSISSRGVISDSKAEIGIDYSGDDLDIAFDIRVLQEAVNFCAATGADDVEIAMSGPASIASVRPIDVNDNALALIMPVRTVAV